MDVAHRVVPGAHLEGGQRRVGLGGRRLDGLCQPLGESLRSVGVRRGGEHHEIGLLPPPDRIGQAGVRPEQASELTPDGAAPSGTSLGAAPLRPRIDSERHARECGVQPQGLSHELARASLQPPSVVQSRRPVHERSRPGAIRRLLPPDVRAELQHQLLSIEWETEAVPRPGP